MRAAAAPPQPARGQHCRILSARTDVTGWLHARRESVGTDGIPCRAGYSAGAAGLARAYLPTYLPMRRYFSGTDGAQKVLAVKQTVFRAYGTGARSSSRKNRGSAA